MSQVAPIEGKTNYVQSRSNRLIVYDPSMLAFLLGNKTYRPIIEATKSMKGQQLFVPYIYDIIQGRKLALVKVYPRGTSWTSAEDYSGKAIHEFHPSSDSERSFQQVWTEINRIFTQEMLRMQATVVNGRHADEFVMMEKDKISVMSEALKAKSPIQYDSSVHLLSANLSMVYFMERSDKAPCVGIVLQESFPIDPIPRHSVGSKRKLEKGEEETVEKSVESSA